MDEVRSGRSVPAVPYIADLDGLLFTEAVDRIISRAGGVAYALMDGRIVLWQEFDDSVVDIADLDGADMPPRFRRPPPPSALSETLAREAAPARARRGALIGLSTMLRDGRITVTARIWNGFAYSGDITALQPVEWRFLWSIRRREDGGAVMVRYDKRKGVWTAREWAELLAIRVPPCAVRGDNDASGDKPPTKPASPPRVSPAELGQWYGDHLTSWRAEHDRLPSQRDDEAAATAQFGARKFARVLLRKLRVDHKVSLLPGRPRRSAP